MVSILMSDIVALRDRGVWQGVINIIYATGAASGAPLGMAHVLVSTTVLLLKTFRRVLGRFNRLALVTQPTLTLWHVSLKSPAGPSIFRFHYAFWHLLAWD